MINTSKLFSTEDIAGLLRQADFSAENNGFKSQLRNRLQSYSEDMECETPEQLIELAKTEGIELTKEKAKAYLAQMEDSELDSKDLQKATGGAPLWCIGIKTK